MYTYQYLYLKNSNVDNGPARVFTANQISKSLPWRTTKP